MNPVELLRDRLGDLTHLLDDSALTRGIYSSDASLYRVSLLVVAHPENRDQLITLVRAALECRLPVIMRGAGTSCAGNAVGAGLVIDVAKHLNRIHVVDERIHAAVIDPGVAQETPQRAAVPYGLRLGPDPSTSSRCTVGGMIENNAYGSRTLGYGRMSDNVVELEVIGGRGQLWVLDRDDFPELRSLVMAHLGVIRTEFGRFSRQAPGYSMEHLLPEKKFDVAKFFAGTEGTLGIITRATVHLTPDPSHRLIVALGYPSMDRARGDISRLLEFHPTACEGLDRCIVDMMIRKRGTDSVGRLPAGEDWMFVELTGEDPAEIRNRAEALLVEADTRTGWIVEDQEQAVSLWKLRADGAGLTGVLLDKPAYGSWENAAVPSGHLGGYLRDFETLLAWHGLHSLPYGHFGDGCVHARIDFPFEAPDGRARYHAFMLETAEMVASHDGSMSGGHGDGCARSELLPRVYSPEALKLLDAVKHLFDPENPLDPGVLVDPEPTDSNLRMVAATASPLNLEDPEFVARVHQCSGVGRCLSDTTASGGVMCPSYQATRDEKDSTRGQARALQEMVNGSPIAGGWRSREVARALDLCLPCKGCPRDCPTGIDMAAYKSRVTHERLKGRLRSRNHYSLDWLPRRGRLTTKFPGIGPLINIVEAAPGLGSPMKWVAGADGRRQIPRFVSRSVRRRTTLPEGGGRGPVLIWVDSFSDCFESNSLAAVVQVLARLGYASRALNEKACCGLTWISTGQLDSAHHQLRHVATVLTPFIERGIPIVDVEPSCTNMWRPDAPELLPGDTNVKVLRGKVLTLAEFLVKDPDFLPPDLSGHTIVAQSHCHHTSVIGQQADRTLLKTAGAELVQVGGCCGLAGNLGVEVGHHEVDVKIFKRDLGLAVTVSPEAIVLADGFDCQTQLKGLAGRDSMSLAELLAAHPARSA